jgi:hypothetical protein
VVLGSGGARSRGLQVISVGITLSGLIASQYLLVRHDLAAFVAEQGGSLPVLLSPDDALVAMRDSLEANRWLYALNLVLWGWAIWYAWWIPAPRSGSGQGLRLPAATGRVWQLAGLAAGAVVLGGLGVSVAMMATQDQLAAVSGHFNGDLQIGQCYQDSEQDQLNVVPCSQRHDGEVFAIVPLPGKDLPSEAELERLSDQACAAQFRAYVGVASQDPDLYFYGWANGDGTMVCTLETLDSSGLVGSMRS